MLSLKQPFLGGLLLFRSSFRFPWSNGLHVTDTAVYSIHQVRLSDRNTSITTTSQTPASPPTCRLVVTRTRASMRLINVKTLGLEEFLGDDVPRYAILSHTWGSEEVSFPWFNVNGPHRNHDFAGYKKVLQCCAQAERDGYRYAWVDTCCIDKTSSADLSEAINSMFYWYKSAAVCYAFLSDVDLSATHSRDERDSAIRQSRWFTRGWTLQEFLAPREVIFYDTHWTLIAPKGELVELLASITGIAPKFIDGTDDIYDASIAQRMSWTSKRQTTRVEDTAYCLLGIFDVNMPLLYGERETAFLRLQEEIIRRTEDHSYLAWGFQMPLNHDYHGLFARSPRAFAGCREVIHDETRCSGGGLVQVTNKGLLMPLHILSEKGQYPSNPITDCLALLPCCRYRDKNLAFPVDHGEMTLKDNADVWRIPGGPPVTFSDAGGRKPPLTVFLKKVTTCRVLEIGVLASAG